MPASKMISDAHNSGGLAMLTCGGCSAGWVSDAGLVAHAGLVAGAK